MFTMSIKPPEVFAVDDLKLTSCSPASVSHLENS